MRSAGSSGNPYDLRGSSAIITRRSLKTKSSKKSWLRLGEAWSRCSGITTRIWYTIHLLKWHRSFAPLSYIRGLDYYSLTIFTTGLSHKSGDAEPGPVELHAFHTSPESLVYYRSGINGRQCQAGVFFLPRKYFD